MIPPLKIKGLIFIIPLLFILTVSLYVNLNQYFDLIHDFYASVFQLISFLSLIAVCLFYFQIDSNLKVSFLDLLVLMYSLYIILNKLFHIDNFSYEKDIYNQISYLSIYLFVRFSVTDPKMFNLAVATLISFSIMNLIIGFLQAIGVVSIISDIYSITGTFANPAPFAGYLILLAPLSFLLFPNNHDSITKKARVVIYFLFVLAIIYSRSRAGILSIIAISTIIFLVKYPLKLSKVRIIIVSVSLMLIFSMLIFFLYKIRPLSAEGRLLIWKVSTGMVDRSAVFGNGKGFVDDNYSLYQARYLKSSKATDNEKYLSGEVHTTFNEFLSIFIEEGLVGLLIFLGIVFVVIRFFLQNYRLKNSLCYLPLGFFGVLIFAFFSYPFHVVALNAVIYIILGLVASKYNYSTKMHLPTFNRLHSILVVSLLLFFCTNVIFNMKSIKGWHRARELVNYNTAESLRIFKNLKSRLRNNVPFMYNYAAELADLGYYKQAVYIFEEIKLTHHDINLYSQIGRCYEFLNEHKKSEMNYRIASDMRPFLLKPKVLLFNLYEESGEKIKAKRQALNILNTPVKIPTLEAERIRSDMKIYLLGDSLYDGDH